MILRKFFFNKIIFFSSLIFIIINIANTIGGDTKTVIKIINYSPTNLKPLLKEGSILKFSITFDAPDDVNVYSKWLFDGEEVKTDIRTVGPHGTRYSEYKIKGKERKKILLAKDVKDTITYVYSPHLLSSGRHLIEVLITDKISSAKHSWTVTVKNVDNSCGDGIWNVGEDVNNCPQDTNKYSLPPSDKLHIVDTEDYTIGMFIFPAWHGDPIFLKNSWKPVINAKSNPEFYGVGQEHPKKPILNYYDDSNPVAVDWMIKWCLENGIKLFIYDWYNSYFNEIPIDIFLEEFENKYHAYKDNAKFALMWANHDIPFGAKTENILRVFDQVEKKYFAHPQYFKINNKPVFFIFDLNNLINVFGKQGTNELFKKMKTRMKGKGYDGLYIVLNNECNISTKEPLAFDAVTGYNYSGKMKFPKDSYDNFIKKYSETWLSVYNRCQKLKNLQGKPINYLLPVSTGWDNTPWEDRYSFPMYISVITDSTPQKFMHMLKKAKYFADHKNINPKVIIVNAWDEWAETGSVLAPRADKWGFGYLEAIRSVFSKDVKKKIDKDG